MHHYFVHSYKHFNETRKNLFQLFYIDIIIFYRLSNLMVYDRRDYQLDVFFQEGDRIIYKKFTRFKTSYDRNVNLNFDTRMLKSKFNSKYPIKDTYK